MKVFAYGRVSTDKQELSPESQRMMCENWLNYVNQQGKYPEGFDVAGWYFDQAVSAGKYRFFERPKGQEIMLHAKRGDLILVSNFDRIFRSTLDCCIVVQHLECSGIGLVILDADFDTTTPIGRACMKFLSVVKELEREEIARRTREANRVTISRGGYAGSPPVGWKKGPRRKGTQTLVPDEGLRRYAEKAVELYEAGMSFNDIGFELRGWGYGRKGHTSVAKWIRAHYDGYPTQYDQYLEEQAKKKAEQASRVEQQHARVTPRASSSLTLEPPLSSALT